MTERGRPGFTLDLARCVGCGACVLACRIENRLRPQVSWRRILQVNRSRVGGGPTYHFSVACHHCEEPPCVVACPSHALDKRADGLVLLDAGRCIGCRYCEMACPFEAPAFDSEAGVMTKCHLCHHRLDDGLAPACVAGCPTGALALILGAEGGLGDQEDSNEKTVMAPAAHAPGFIDPASARPGFWVAEPRGAIRSLWYSGLRGLHGEGGGGGRDRE
ncbi:MAG: 4Fe-4S dicluster domain-containing protein [Gemmatimonadetes bacterium]|nr:4Fe-4S dicluster domain-containing protein [Gemmatimonadota bacterium]NNM06204.1 4Fe-4S dicluster domain-containing protein [Gemmatimonadota bacterium]